MSLKLDNKLLHALAVVVRDQSFERAATSLFITQSAVSQRIKQLEQLVAQPVIIRSQPLVATDIGKQLISHYHQVMQLEADLLPNIFNEDSHSPVTLNLATNADSLATWLIPALSPLINAHFIECNFLVADENHTIDKLKDGESFGAISLEPQAIKGCQVTPLGDMNYILVASPQFQETYFSDGINQESLRRAPGVAFDHKDNMHIRFIEQQYGLKQGEYPLHTARSSEAFVTLAEHGAAYCLIAELQIRSLLASGALVNILPEYQLVETLHWHRWAMLKGIHEKVSQAIIREGQAMLD